MKIFVLMPFAEEFDDVYHIIKASVALAGGTAGADIECYRADEIEVPGKISAQVLAAIRSADLVVAELTGSNPNVMYELGYAHALGKEAVILNQAVHNSPFDVKDFRQITYDRTRLSKDCQPSLVASVTAVIQSQRGGPGGSGSVGSLEAEGDSVEEGTADLDGGAAVLLRPGPELTNEVQRIQLELRYLESVKDRKGAAVQANLLLDLLGRISVVGTSDSDSLRNAIGGTGNCAVVLESLDLCELAEKIYRKAIGIVPDYEGVHIQYADMLADLDRMDEAREELKKSKSIAPEDPRIVPLEMKIALGSGSIPSEFAERLREDFESDPADDRKATAYLLYLAKGDDAAEFERVSTAWAAASDDPYGPSRALADYLASSRSDEHMRRAAELYKELIPDCPDDQIAPMLHNLATCLYHFDADEEAEQYWRQAYALDPSSHSIQSAFSQLLDRKGDLKNARSVARGEPLGEVVSDSDG